MIICMILAFKKKLTTDGHGYPRNISANKSWGTYSVKIIFVKICVNSWLLLNFLSVRQIYQQKK